MIDARLGDPRPSTVRYAPPTAVIVAVLCLWALAFAALTMGFEITPKYFWGLASRRLITCIMGAGLSLAIFPILEGVPSDRPRTKVAAACALSVLAAIAYSAINYLIFNLIPVVPNYMPFWPAMVVTGRFVFWFFAACTMGFVAWSYHRRAQDRDLALETERALSVEAQHRLLRYQLNPHFLFNTLNALHQLIIEGDRSRSEEMLLSLSAFLRRTIDSDRPGLIELHDELDTIEDYLSIEKIRYGSRLKFCHRATPDALESKVPGFILQPLIENAIKHGLANTARPVSISLEANVQNFVLNITIMDDGPGAKPIHGPRRVGVGLQNVKERLAVAYGGAATCAYGPLEGGGFSVQLRLPQTRLLMEGAARSAGTRPPWGKVVVR